MAVSYWLLAMTFERGAWSSCARGSGEVEESQLAGGACQDAFGLQLQHACDEAVAWIEEQAVHEQRGAGAGLRGILRPRQLEAGVHLHRRTARARIVDEHPAT